MLFTLCAIVLYETGPIQWMFSQHCGYWWPGALAPGHQQPQCWLRNHAYPNVMGLIMGLSMHGKSVLILSHDPVLPCHLYLAVPETQTISVRYWGHPIPCLSVNIYPGADRDVDMGYWHHYLGHRATEQACQGGDSISHKMSFRKISQSLRGMGLVGRVFQLLWNLAGKFQSDKSLL